MHELMHLVDARTAIYGTSAISLDFCFCSSTSLHFRFSFIRIRFLFLPRSGCGVFFNECYGAGLKGGRLLPQVTASVTDSQTLGRLFQCVLTFALAQYPVHQGGRKSQLRQVP